ncbi:CBO0543 family protein [Paenibacillus oryzisoli]|uniref:CBO0543 family protein n=1 Tax=Paenibacillus oryzisoli TaxID=1850517 RepID=UPI000A6C2946|nr:CBO0543 family protein [Paenibacillus oryzisoli]
MGRILFNILIGFVVPWLLGLAWFKKAPTIAILISPISAIVSTIINDIGYHVDFWDFTPKIEDDETISALPFDIGLYPLAACVGIYWIDFKKKHPLGVLIVLSFILTCLEYIVYLLGKLEYNHGWTIGWTFVSYFIAVTSVYGFYALARKHGVNFTSIK